MKLLAFADMHGSTKALNSVKRKARNVDMILCLGDFTIFELDMEKILKKFDAIGKPVLIIPGNHEIGGNIEKLTSKSKNLYYIDESFYETQDLIVLAAEGNGFAMKDKHFDKAGKKLMKLLPKEKKKVILMTHAPPFGTRHDLLIDEHCGNKSVKNLIKKMQPDYALSGHLHENSYTKDTIGKTKTLNPGPEGRIIRI